MSKSKENWAGVESKNKRLQLDEEAFDIAIDKIKRKLKERQKQKGMGTYASSHETMGIIADEFIEYRDEVHDKNQLGQVVELIDIAVGAIWGIASINSGGQDW